MNKNHRCYQLFVQLSFLGFALLMSACQTKTNKKEQPAVQDQSLPNIVVILADDMGYGDISSLNEHALLKTPNIDSLKRSGVSFNDAHASSSVCTPSRYSLLTGEYAWRSTLKRGVTWGLSQPIIPDDKPTIASYLKSAGYHTACIGKWHLGLGWQPAEGETPPWEMSDVHPSQYDASLVDFDHGITSGPMSLGFDYFFGIPASLDMTPYVFIEDNKVLGLPLEPVEEAYHSEIPGLKQWKSGVKATTFEHDRVLPALMDKAVSYVKTRSQNEQPYFLYLSLTAPHSPILPAEEFKGKSAAGPYGDFVEMVDAQVGRIMKAVGESGESDNTLIVFTSDNGSPLFYLEPGNEHTPNYIYRGQKADIYEGGHRIPFIASWPGQFAENKEIAIPVLLNDLFATVADLTNLPMPEHAAPDSESMLPLLYGKSGYRMKRPFLVHHSSRGMFAIRKDGLKLIDGLGSGGFTKPATEVAAPGTPEYQFFNLKEDPSEHHDQAVVPRSEDASRLLKELRLYIETSAED